MAGPDYSNAGAKRDLALRAIRLSRQPVPRALLADLATNATNATNASNVASIPTDAPKVVLDDEDLVALVTDEDTIQPVTLQNLRVFLESKYVLTPAP